LLSCTDAPTRQLLPEVVADESPHVPYHPGSPWGDGQKTSNPTVGDMHQWNGSRPFAVNSRTR
jgi:beta-mannosidase